jgi:gamma-glutamylcyclotransferase (GGCT)/AIG2-like uncharacterized protein YtfP
MHALVLRNGIFRRGAVTLSEYLFVYGTLLTGAAPEAMNGIVRRLRYVGPAIVPGYLYDLGSYPGIRLDLNADAIVRGELLSVASAATWLRLDTYEGFDRARPERSLFRRQRTRVTRSDTGDEGDVWIYVYNRDLGDAPRIESGCWRTHLRDNDVRALPI